jgi:serine/threonine protein kinase
VEQGRFTTAIPLGRGASGTVYRAFDPALGHEVALKVIPVRDAQSAARVQREVRVQASLQHPDICRVYGIEQHQGDWVLVLQLVEGESFDALLPREPSGVRLALLLRIARAVQHAHEQGIVHRDLKP